MITLTASALQPGKSRFVRDGLFYCSNVYKLDRPVAEVLAALEGDWDRWWTMGRRYKVRKDERGVTHWTFVPLRFTGKMVWFDIDMEPTRVELNAAGKPEKLVLAFTLEGACHGPARYEIYAAPDGGTLLRGAWDGVRPRGWRRFAPGMLGLVHVLVEDRAVANLNRVPA